MTDGGYYALKGFCFQYDKTLIEVLKQKESIETYIEQTEDFSTDDSIYQIKYRESADYTNSKIKKPICQLIELYKHDKRKFILFAHFKNKSKSIFKPNLAELKLIIGNCIVKKKTYQFSEELLSEFAQNIEIHFAENYIEQYNILLQLIEDVFTCTRDESIIIYPQLRSYVENIVIHNAPDNLKKRTVTKDELIKYIKTNRELIFYQAYTEFIGKEKYFKLIKKKFFTESNINHHQRFFIVDIDCVCTDDDLLQISNLLIDKYAKYSVGLKKMVKSPAPHIFFKNISDERLFQLKVSLIDNGRNIKDGFPIKGDYFSLDNLTQKCTVYNQVSVKFIESSDMLINALQKYPSDFKKIYYFYINNHENIPSSCEKHVIGIASTNDLKSIF